MNWKTIKTFLIFLFLAVDIFLLAVTYRFYTFAKLSDQTIADTLALLEKNGITANAGIIPRSAYGTENIQLTNLYYSDIAEKSKSQIKLTGNGRLSMTIPVENIPSDASDMPDYILKNLYSLGFDTKNITVVPANERYIMTYSINKIPVFNNMMEITVTDNTLRLVGNWYVNEKQNISPAKGASSAYATSALIEFISNPGRGNDPATVKAIDTGYYAHVSGEMSDIKIISASPCYRLTMDDNKVYYYSIPDSKFIN